MNAYRLKLYGLACASALVLAACGGGGGYSGGMFVPVVAAATRRHRPRATGTAAVTGTSFAATNLVSDLPVANNPVRQRQHRPAPGQRLGRGLQPERASSGWRTTGRRPRRSTTATACRNRWSWRFRPAPPATPCRPASSSTATRTSWSRRTASPAPAPSSSPARPARLSGWSPAVDTTNAVTVFDGGSRGHGLHGPGARQPGRVGLPVRGGFSPRDGRHVRRELQQGRHVAGSFVDPALPAGYAPFGIQAIGDLIYVSYARQDAQARNAVAGAGLGVVDVFDTAGQPRQAARPARRCAQCAVGHGDGAGRLRPVQQRIAGRQCRRRQDQRVRPDDRRLDGHALRRPTGTRS